MFAEFRSISELNVFKRSFVVAISGFKGVFRAANVHVRLFLVLLGHCGLVDYASCETVAFQGTFIRFSTVTVLLLSIFVVNLGTAISAALAGIGCRILHVVVIDKIFHVAHATVADLYGIFVEDLV